MAPNDPAIDAATSFTSDLIVEGHRGVGNPLAVDAVQDSAHDGEAHHAEDGLHTASSHVTPFMTDSICRTEEERAEWNSYLQFQAVVLHLEVHAGRSDVKGDPLPSVERHLQPRNRGGTVTEAWKQSKRFVRSITTQLPEESIQLTAGRQAVTLLLHFG